MSTLETYRGRDVVGAAVKVTKAGDGLSEAIKIAPIDVTFGDRVLVVMECVVTNAQHRPAIKGDLAGPLQLVWTLEAESAMFTNDTRLAKTLDRFKQKLSDAREIEGQQSILSEVHAGDEDDYEASE